MEQISVSSFEELGEARTAGAAVHRAGEQHRRPSPPRDPDPRLTPCRSAGRRIACSSSSAVSGGTVSFRSANSSPNRGQSSGRSYRSARIVAITRSLLVGIDRGDPQGFEEVLLLAFVDRKREQLLELIHDEDELPSLAASRAPRRPGGHATRPKDVAEAVGGRAAIRTRAVSSSSHGCAPGNISTTNTSLAAARPPLRSRGHQARTDDRGLSAAARPDDSEEPGSLAGLVQPREEALRELDPSEEVDGIRLGERAQAFVRVALSELSSTWDRTLFEDAARDVRDSVRVPLTRSLPRPPSRSSLSAGGKSFERKSRDHCRSSRRSSLGSGAGAAPTRKSARYAFPSPSSRTFADPMLP